MNQVQQVFEERLIETAKVLEDQIDAEIEKLEKMEDEELQAIERKRALALKKQVKQKEELVTSGHGVYSEIPHEKDFFEVCKKSKRVVCHFYRSSTMRCKIVDKHLEALAPRHIETRFCKIDAEKSFFIVQRLKIRVLPTIALLKDDKIVDYIVGFDDLGGVDDFSTEMMEWRIAQAGVINYSGDLTAPPGSSKKPKSIFMAKKKTIRGGCNESDTDSD
ncbi:thioredoxin domain-containing protein 9 [Parasteatoda tepidariorum]|uniref:thioredoxin domain-containing protein 9 n=1 Tax=Parasteatoda tepidariorum TaxID=114398 RepID=UPI00077F8D92|nr:thioredoxin domain-containing protein 9 [Parasteatoda tepidariorum]XP_042896902.1 thioredoxin domain-containing protein 9 [Parasteatoda tepidariorum]